MHVDTWTWEVHQSAEGDNSPAVCRGHAGAALSSGHRALQGHRCQHGRQYTAAHGQARARLYQGHGRGQRNHVFSRAARKIMAAVPATEAQPASEWEAMRRRHHFGDEQIRALWDWTRSLKDSHDDMNFTPADLGQ